MNPDHEKERELMARSEELMAEMAKMILPAELVDQLEERMKRHFKVSNIPYHRSNLRAFFQGMLFLISVKGVPNSQMFEPVLPGVVKLILNRMDKDMKESADKL